MKATDFVNSVSYDKKNLIRDSDSSEAAEKLYVPFFTSRCLSYHPDAILLLNELNARGLSEFGMNNIEHYEFLLHVLPKKKRFSKWGKQILTDDTEVVKKYYDYSTERALEVMELHTDADMKMMRDSMYEGGKIK